MFNESKRIVIKIGSAALSSDKSPEFIATLASDCFDLIKQGKEIVIVTSGAVALGRKKLQNVVKLEEKQAAAAIGQIMLMQAYQDNFAVHGLTVAQLLLTPDDTENRRRHLNARNTIESLLSHSVIPIINENDTVATEEIRFGDNDRLSARVAQMIGANLLIILSDIDGLYTANPNEDRNAQLIKVVEKITPKIEAMAKGALKGGVGTGGMASKIMAAKIANASGCDVIIAKAVNNPIADIDNRMHTRFISNVSPASARKKWIMASLKPKGVITIDDGAEKALRKGKSLLPAGVKKISGRFERGDAVTINNINDEYIGIGLIAYSSDDSKLIIGKHSTEIIDILGFEGREELIHRDDMVI